MNNLRKIAAGSLAAVLAFSMAACGSSNASSDGTGESTGKAVTVNEKSAKATSLADFGTMEDLEKAAKEEGALNVIALPHDWSNYGEVIESFKKKYPEIKVTELNPNASSKEELDAAKTNKGTDAAPDVFDVGQAIAATSTDYFAPYKVQAWDKIPDTAKDADGAYYADYTGIMSVGWNADKYGDISSLDDLLDPKFAGTVALNGKPAEAGAAFNGYLMANQLAGGDINNLQPGLDYFKKLKEAGNLTTVDVTNGTIDSGQTGVVFGQRVPLLAGSAKGDSVAVLVRPENLTLALAGSSDSHVGERARVEVIHFLGSLVRVDTVITSGEYQRWNKGEQLKATVQLPASELPAGLAVGDDVIVTPRPVAALAC